jgi:hypothetical protein
MSNKEVAYQFITTWRDKSQGRLEAELTSFSNESNRRPDSYFFEFEDGKLIDPQTKRPIFEFIDKKTKLGKKEAVALQKLEIWMGENDGGISFWISPPFEGKYPCSKIIISKIVYTWEGKKVLTNSAILFDANGDECLTIYPEGQIENPEILRTTPVFSEDSEEAILKVLNRIEKYTKHKSINLKIEEESLFFARMISGGYGKEQIVYEMQKTGFLGNFSLSCATTSQTFSEYVVANSNVINNSENGKFVKNCGNCGANINSVIQKGYRCPSCGGIYEGC